MDFVGLASLFFNIKKWFTTDGEKSPPGEHDERGQGMNNAGTSSNMIQAGDNATVIVGGEVPFAERENELYYKNSDGKYVPVPTGYRFWTGTQAEYHAIDTKRDDTLYFVTVDND